MSDVFFEGLLTFVLLLVGFAVLSSVAALGEWYMSTRQRRRQAERELLPEPDTRTVVRRRGWQVPM
jgi:hypothetical protein